MTARFEDNYEKYIDFLFFSYTSRRNSSMHTLQSLTLHGLSGAKVEVEVDVALGMGQFTIV